MSVKEPAWSHRTLAVFTIVCWLVATGMLVAIMGSVTPEPSEPGLSEEHGSLVARIFGSSRTVLSRHLFLEADRYFHKGIRVRPRRAFSDALFIGWADEIAPTRHEEIEGSNLSEIMPWLQMSIGADSRNFEACAAAGYWLLQQRNMNAAVTLMEDAQQNNPGDYRFYSALGQLYFFNQDYVNALAELRRARELWPRFKGGDEEDRRRGLGEILTYQAGINEALGNRAVALKTYRELRTIFPERAHLDERIAELAADSGSDTVQPIPMEHREVRHHILQFRNAEDHVHHSGCTHD